MPDDVYADPRLAVLYDVFDDDRSDLDPYVAILAELGARAVLDLGCGTGTLALRLADRDLDVVGVDPALASLDVARAKPGADRVEWRLGDAAGGHRRPRRPGPSRARARPRLPKALRLRPLSAGAARLVT